MISPSEDSVFVRILPENLGVKSSKMSMYGGTAEPTCKPIVGLKRIWFSNVVLAICLGTWLRDVSMMLCLIEGILGFCPEAKMKNCWVSNLRSIRPKSCHVEAVEVRSASAEWTVLCDGFHVGQHGWGRLQAVETGQIFSMQVLDDGHDHVTFQNTGEHRHRPSSWIYLGYMLYCTWYYRS